MAAPAGIDWQWARSTGGNLSARQKRQLVAPFLRLFVRYPAVRLALATGRRGSASIDLDAIRWPDSGLARAAQEEAEGAMAPYLVAHSYRTYLFGLMLAQAARAAVDEELVFIASLLHDVTLGTPRRDHCFAVSGGEHAERFVLDHGCPAERASAIGAAVAGHITPGASEDLRDPAGFVSAGALADITAIGLQHAPRAWVDAVLAAHPRERFHQQLLPDWKAAADAVPDGRSHWMNRYTGLPLLVRWAPL